MTGNKWINQVNTKIDLVEGLCSRNKSRYEMSVWCYSASLLDESRMVEWISWISRISFCALTRCNNGMVSEEISKSRRGRWDFVRPSSWSLEKNRTDGTIFRAFSWPWLFFWRISGYRVGGIKTTLWNSKFTSIWVTADSFVVAPIFRWWEIDKMETHFADG